MNRHGDCQRERPSGFVPCDRRSRAPLDRTETRRDGIDRDAIGARVHIAAGGADQWQEVRGGGSYQSQNDLRVLGLGAAAIVDRVDVRWPNGGEEHWTHRAADRLHTIVEGIR